MFGVSICASEGSHIMSDRRDIQHGVNDSVSGVDVKFGNRNNATPREKAQWAADVRAAPSVDPTEEFPPEALRHPPAPPLNKRTGRHQSE